MGCSQNITLYDPTKSNTSNITATTSSLLYADGQNVSGIVGTETVGLGALSGVQANFLFINRFEFNSPVLQKFIAGLTAANTSTNTGNVTVASIAAVVNSTSNQQPTSATNPIPEAQTPQTSTQATASSLATPAPLLLLPFSGLLALDNRISFTNIFESAVKQGKLVSSLFALEFGNPPKLHFNISE